MGYSGRRMTVPIFGRLFTEVILSRLALKMAEMRAGPASP